jgi:hypothetical protein
MKSLLLLFLSLPRSAEEEEEGRRKHWTTWTKLHLESHPNAAMAGVISENAFFSASKEIFVPALRESFSGVPKSFAN